MRGRSHESTTSGADRISDRLRRFAVGGLVGALALMGTGCESSSESANRVNDIVATGPYSGYPQPPSPEQNKIGANAVGVEARAIANQVYRAVNVSKTNYYNRDPDQVTGVATWTNEEARKHNPNLPVATLQYDPNDGSITATQVISYDTVHGKGDEGAGTLNFSVKSVLILNDPTPPKKVRLRDVHNWMNSTAASSPLLASYVAGLRAGGAQVFYAMPRDPNTELQKVVPLGADWDVDDRLAADLAATEEVRQQLASAA